MLAGSSGANRGKLGPWPPASRDWELLPSPDRKVRRQLRRRIKRAITAGKPDIEAFHDVRKAGKKTRYLLELFGPLLPKDHHRLLKRLKKIQQPLGELNDLAVSESLLRQNLRLISTPDQAKKLERWLKRKRKRRQSTPACCAGLALKRPG
jgi:CHAD domain-containing protein